MIVIVWHILASDTACYQELGTDYFDRRNDAAARQRYLVRELERLGNHVTVQPAAFKSASCNWAARACRPPTAARAEASRLTDTVTTPRPETVWSRATWVLTRQPVSRATSAAAPAASTQRARRGGQRLPQDGS